MSKLRILTAAAILLALAATARAQDVKDTIVQKDGSSVQGEIVKETFKDVSYSLGPGVKSGVNRDRVERVDYANKPGRFDEAMSNTNSGNFTQAGDSWEKVLKECDSGGARKIFKQHAYYYGAIARSRGGDVAKAIDWLTNLFTEFPDTMYYVDAYNLQAECYMAMGKFGEATNIAKTGSTKGKEIGVPDDLLLQLDLIKARALEAQGKFAEASGEYKVVAGKAARFPSVANLAKLGTGRCLVGNKQYSEAESYFNDLAEKAEDGPILAGAYNGLGDCYKDKFERDVSNIDHLRKALFAYLRGVVLYTPGKGDDTSEHARALVNAGWCFEKLKDTMPTPEAKEKYKSNARNLYRECLGSYRGTKSAEEAENRLKRLD